MQDRGGSTGKRIGVAALAVAAAAGVVLVRNNGVATQTLPAANRILVLSLPTVTWKDLRGHHTPNLDALLARSAITNVSSRSAGHGMTLGAAYTSINAGTPAVTGKVAAGTASATEHTFESGTVGEAAARRTNRRVTGIAFPDVAALTRVNHASEYDATVGILGDLLGRAGVDRAVIANADVTSPNGDVVPGRAAVLALMGSDGAVPHGAVDDAILRLDPAAPYGVALDSVAVESAFTRVWHDRTVTLVEASDLVRANEYDSVVSEDAAPAIHADALARTDALVGRLLTHIDWSRDAVVVVSPGASGIGHTLTMAAIAAPNVAPGYALSSNTRTRGTIVLNDLGPTIATLAGVAPDASMDGRALTTIANGSDLASRREHLISLNRTARDRDKIVNTMKWLFGFAQLALVAGAVFLATTSARKGWRVLGHAALAVLLFIPCTYLAAFTPLARLGWGPYAVGLGAAASAFAFLAWRVRGVGRPLVIACIVTALVPLLGLIAFGNRLQRGTIFGDSTIVAGRFYGVNNLTFSLIMGSAVIGAALLARRPGWGRLGATALVSFALLVIVTPSLGADVGGILAGVPAVALFLSALWERRPRVRSVVLFGLCGIAAFGVLGALDLSRPESARSHLGRFLEKIGAQGWGGFTTVVERKLDASLATLDKSVWMLVILVGGAALAILARRAPTLVRDAWSVREVRVAALGLGALGVLGFALNDSGLAVPGMLLAVANASGVYLLARRELSVTPARPPAPA